MTLEQLLVAVRDLLDDHATPPLYSDEELTRYLNNAVGEAALRLRCLQDDSSDLCRITTVPDQTRYTVADEVLVVRAVHVTGRSDSLTRTTAERLDRIRPGWSHEVQASSVPQYVLFDLQQKMLTLFPAPATAGTLYLRVWRLPLPDEQMEGGQDEPAIVLPDPESLKHWALHEAYLKKDAELYDPERAAQHEDVFTRVFGPRPSTHDLMLWSTQPITGPRLMQPDY